jgi:hypothetical protein
MASARLTTWSDLIDHLVDWLGSSPGAEAHRDARRASLGGLRDLANAHRWSYFYGRGRVVTSAPYSAGTVSYDHTGGSSERLLTLSGGAWPSWAAQGTVRVGEVGYDAATRLSDTQLTLSSTSNPGADLAAGTAYTLVRDTYPLPQDLISVGMLIRVGGVHPLAFEHPSTWLERQRVYTGPADPRTYCLRGSPDFLGQMALSLHPAPDQAYQLDFVYQRQPRQLRIDRHLDGAASCTAGSAAVTGSGTGWAARHVGTVVRFSRSAQNPVTGWAGGNPPAFERVVTAVASATSLTMDDVAPESLSGVKYQLSDPADVEEGAMMTALLRSIEYQMAHARRLRDRAQAEQDYTRALILAREADSRNFRDERVGGVGAYPYRLADMPSGPDA